MPWTTTAFAMLMFSVVGGLPHVLPAALQGHLPLNPQHFSGKDMTADLSFNTFMSVRHQHQLAELRARGRRKLLLEHGRFWRATTGCSAATGMAVAIAIVRGFARHSAKGIGNFWVDMTRSTLYVLLPICLVLAIVLVWQGGRRTSPPTLKRPPVEGATQTIAQGPVASQEAIKMLGTNGGGILNANSSHPYEKPDAANPTCWRCFAAQHRRRPDLHIPARWWATTPARLGDLRGDGGALRLRPGHLLLGRGARQSERHEARRGGGCHGRPARRHMEGKETRFGIANSALFATVTTDASCGAVNSMHDSFTPVGGAVPLVEPDVRRDNLRWRGRGALRDAHVCDPRGLHRGPHGGPKRRSTWARRWRSSRYGWRSSPFSSCSRQRVSHALAANAAVPPGKDSATFTDAQKAEEAGAAQGAPRGGLKNHVGTG